MSLKKLLYLAVVIAIFPSAALAQVSSITTITSNEDIVSAYVMLLNPPNKSASETEPQSSLVPATVERINGNKWNIIFDIPVKEVNDLTRYSVVATTVSGTVLPGNVKWLNNSRPQLISNAQCEASSVEDQITKLSSTDEKALEILVDVRKTRNEVLRKQLKSLLQDPIIHQLNRKETHLGLYHQEVINQNTSLEDLASRIAKIKILQELDYLR